MQIMYYGWAGHIGKSIASKKRPRIFWNFFWGGGIILIIFAMLSFTFQATADRLTYSLEQFFVEQEAGYLITDVDTFELADKEKQETPISELTKKVKSGDVIKLSISKLSGELIEVKNVENEIVYKKELTPIMPTVIASAVIVIPMLSLFVFMLIVTNMKHPKGKIKKFQDTFLLRIYKE